MLGNGIETDSHLRVFLEMTQSQVQTETARRVQQHPTGPSNVVSADLSTPARVTRPTSIRVPLASPTIDTPVTFRQSVTDANNHVVTNVAAVFVQDQVEVSRHMQLVGGVRFDRFDLQVPTTTATPRISRGSTIWSRHAPELFTSQFARLRCGTAAAASRTLPSSGDQFSSLTTITQQVKPERFNNYELGVKWDALPALAVTGAVYRLDRTNTRSTDPNDPPRIGADREPAHKGLRIRLERPGDTRLERGGRLCLPGRLCDQCDRFCPRRGRGGTGAAPHVLAVEQL